MKFLLILLLSCWSQFTLAADTTTPQLSSLIKSPANVDGQKSATIAKTAKHAPVTDILEETSFISASDIRQFSRRKDLFLRSHVALVFDERDNELLFQRNAKQIMKVASLTKLMTAMVLLDADLSMDEIITINKKDKDRVRYAKSRLKFGTKLRRDDLLLMALLASENRAAAALGRTYPGGLNKFVDAMNKKARDLGLKKTKFADPAGLQNGNVSTARELLMMVQAASQYPLIRDYTTRRKETITNITNGRDIIFGNTNRLVKKESWPIRLSKTGFTNDAGNCLIMQTDIAGRPVTIVLLNSWGKLSKYGDSNRIKKWLINTERKIKRPSSKQTRT